MQEKYGYFIEDLSLGMTAVFAKTVTEADITMFAGISGDTNPVHLDESFAEKTMFAGRIAHGMLSASFISTVFGTRLPGPGCVYMRQDLRFKAPVKIGDTVQARVTVREIVSEKKRVVFDTVCTVGDNVVLEGEATLMVQARKDVLGLAEETSNQDSPAPIQAAE
jgi:3-hydroxybutyryl-CoA dehydratase